jgi:hypothetical protein
MNTAPIPHRARHFPAQRPLLWPAPLIARRRSHTVWDPGAWVLHTRRRYSAARPTPYSALGTGLRNPSPPAPPPPHGSQALYRSQGAHVAPGTRHTAQVHAASPKRARGYLDIRQWQRRSCWQQRPAASFLLARSRRFWSPVLLCWWWPCCFSFYVTWMGSALFSIC